MHNSLEDSIFENEQFQDVKDAKVKREVLIEEKHIVKGDLYANEEDKKSAAEDVDL